MKNNLARKSHIHSYLARKVEARQNQSILSAGKAPGAPEGVSVLENHGHDKEQEEPEMSFSSFKTSPGTMGRSKEKPFLYETARTRSHRYINFCRYFYYEPNNIVHEGLDSGFTPLRFAGEFISATSHIFVPVRCCLIGCGRRRRKGLG